MKPAVAILALIMLSLAGCGDDEKMSQAEMEQIAPQALTRLTQDIGPAGTLSNVAVEGWVNFEVITQFGPVKQQLPVEAEILIGPAASLHIEGRLSGIQYELYCDAEHIVMITSGLSSFDMEDIDLEYRNLAKQCTGKGAEPLLTRVADFELVEPELLTGELDPQELVFGDVQHVKGQRFLATYINEGLIGNTTLTVEINKGRVVSVTSDNLDSHLVMDMRYGERGTLERPEAAQRSPTKVYGSSRSTDNGWEFTFTYREGAPVEDVVLHVFEDGAIVECAEAPEPVATFTLSDGPDQQSGDFHMVFYEDGDGTVGPGDSLLIRHPGSVGQDWNYDVAFYDTWAQSYMQGSCDIPALGWAMPAVAMLAVGLLRRRK